MIDVAIPRGDAPASVRSFSACLASVTEARPGEVPVPDAELRGAIAHWRSWLVGRGLGLVPLARPRTFNWPGYWIAVLEGGRAALLFGTPSGVVLSPQDESLVGRPAAELTIEEGYVVAGLDPASRGAPATLPELHGTVTAIAVAGAATAPMQAVSRARGLAGRGLEGDRYAAGAGTFTPRTAGFRGYDLTLVEAEVLDALTLADGTTLDHVDARRNVVTRGIELNGLVGRRFRVGDVECLGQRLCEPCSHLERLTGPGVLRPLIHRGGLRADILADGDLEVGSTIETLD